MHKFTHVDAFYQVVRYVEHTNSDVNCPERCKIKTPVSYRGTIKLHGSNAGVACRSDGLYPQSRTRVLSLEDDNYGFAAFVDVDARKNAIRRLETQIRVAENIAPNSTLVLYGEWIGSGIQRGVGISQLDEKQWVLFTVKVVDGEESRYLDALPKLGDEFSSLQIFSIADAPTFSLQVDFGQSESKMKALEYAMQVTDEVERACPWAKRFGVEGVGEGIVWMPVDKHWGNSSLFFKTKGEKHKVTKSKKTQVQLSPEVLANIDEFLEFSLPENRLRQGIEAIREMGFSFDMKSMGEYLKWVGQDVKRECALELESNNLEWKDVSKAVTNKARAFFIEAVRNAATSD